MNANLPLFAVGLVLCACQGEPAKKSAPLPQPASVATESMQRVPPSADADRPPSPERPPETVPEGNDPPDVLAEYQAVRQLIAKGNWERARQRSKAASKRFPERSSLHRQYAEVLWDLSKGRDRDLLQESGHEAARALEIGLRSGKVDLTLTGRLAETLGRIGDRATLDRLFQEILAREPRTEVYLDYARGLSLANDPRAEAMLKKALDQQANGDTLAAYGEWLLDHGHDAEALQLLPASSPFLYLHFLRGVALERLHHPDEARGEYAKFRAYSASFPAPSRFRLSGSRLQMEGGIHFAESGLHSTGRSS
jgi:tetratricopeptide (TPR) repeat protein